MKKVIRFFILNVFLMIFSTCIRAETDVRVNVIVFKHITPDALTSEQWPHEFLYPDLKNVIELTNDVIQEGQPSKQKNNQQNQSLIYNSSGNAYVLLPTEKFELQKELDVLSKQSDCTILFHGSWKQPAVTSNPPLAVHITGGQIYDHNNNELNGKITISKDQFFNADLDLYLSLPELNESRTLQTFRLTGSHHLLPKKIYYFDHPLFGVILMLDDQSLVGKSIFSSLTRIYPGDR